MPTPKQLHQQQVAHAVGAGKPQIMPYYCCDGPEGEKGVWTHLPTNKAMPAGFDPLAIPLDERQDYRYEGPEVIYTFWARHGPCQVTGCGHRTPIMKSAVMAVKTLTVKHWEHTCGKSPTRRAKPASSSSRRLALGRRKWKSQGGYPTLAHGGLSLLEVLTPWVEMTRS